VTASTNKPPTDAIAAGKTPETRVVAAMTKVSVALVLQTISIATLLYWNTDRNLRTDPGSALLAVSVGLLAVSLVAKTYSEVNIVRLERGIREIDGDGF
jgi:hypothetical protein